MGSHASSKGDGCFKPHCFPEIDSAASPANPKAGPDFKEDDPKEGTKGDRHPFIPADPRRKAAAGTDPSFEEQLALARQEGHAEGVAAGQQAAAESLAPVIQALQGAVEALTAQEAQLTAQAEKAVVTLSLAIAEKVIPRAVSELPEALLTVVNQALSKVLAGTRLNLRVNPEDLERLKASQDTLALPDIDPARLTWSPDPGIGTGGCIVETDFGDIDARIEHQLKLIAALFHQQLSKPPGALEGQGTDP
jgi:flagellar biosynthesis/type III secretory pathway protein FliH